MMTIEGHFTAAELSAAMATGATPVKLTYGRVRLTFPTTAAYERWARPVGSVLDMVVLERVELVVPTGHL